MVQSYGMLSTINNNTPMYVTDNTPNAEARYRARFYFNPNSIVMSSGNSLYLFYGLTSTGVVATRIEFGWSGTSYRIRTGIRNNGSTTSNSPWVLISNATHVVEIDWQAATAAGANNGYITLWIDGVQVSNVTGISNDTRRIDSIRLGTVAGVDSGTRGSYYMDAFESRHQTYIGP